VKKVKKPFKNRRRVLLAIGEERFTINLVPGRVKKSLCLPSCSLPTLLLELEIVNKKRKNEIRMIPFSKAERFNNHFLRLLSFSL